MSDNKFDGNKLFEIRRKKKFSQTKLASEIGVTRQTIYLWETNQSIPDIEKVTKICKILEVDIKELIDVTEISESIGINISNNNEENNVNETINVSKSKNNVFLKLIFFVVTIFLFVYILFSTIKFIRLNKILNKLDEFDKLDNYYIEIEEYLVNERNLDIISETVFYDKYYHDGVLKTIVKDRKSNNIINIIICDYNKGKKYVIFEETKTYSIKKIDNDENSKKISSNFSYLYGLRNVSKFKNYINCFNFNFNINLIDNKKYELIFENAQKEVINKDTYLLEYEEALYDNLRKEKRYYKIELNSQKDFEIDLDEYLADYTEIE